MSRILVVTLGGTICSATEGGDTIKLHAAPDADFWKNLKGKNELSFLTPILYSSENADEEYFRKAFEAIIKECGSNKPDAILILHGTDSTAHFAQLAVRVLSFLDLPVIITGSKLPMDDPHSDAVRNVKYALGLLGAASEGKIGAVTFGVVFSDDLMGDTVFTPAARVTDANFAGDYGKFGGKPDVTILKEEEAKAYLASPIKKILTIPDVPGYPYEAIDTAAIDAILIEAYHSGTQSVRGLPELVARAKENGVKVYLAPVHSGKVKYESTKTLLEKGVAPVYDMPVEGAWAEVVIT
ncbi:MAG: asparaginase domain-containing protein [Saccharofermentans sp.]|nr:asparaginase domain-containing protein [Saccharofermentans sp.]